MSGSVETGRAGALVMRIQELARLAGVPVALRHGEFVARNLERVPKVVMVILGFTGLAADCPFARLVACLHGRGSLLDAMAPDDAHSYRYFTARRS